MLPSQFLWIFIILMGVYTGYGSYRFIYTPNQDIEDMHENYMVIY